MAILTSYLAIGIREDLTDKLVRTGDGEAMFLSNLQKRSVVGANQKLHEWQDWALTAPTANSAAEGFTPVTATVARNRRSNYVQIMHKAFLIADSVLEGVDIAGVKNEYQFQADAAFTGLRRDIEWAFWNNAATASGTSAGAVAVMVGVLGAITTNSAAPAATTSVLTEAEFINALKQIFTARGVFFNVDVHATPLDVTRIMGYTGPGTATKILQVTETTTVHNRQVSVIVTNFGKAAIVPNNIVPLGSMAFCDMQTWALAVKVPPKLKAVAKTTDSTTAYWKTELTLEWLNQSANAKVTGLATA